ncbi:MAG: hypothetical protein ACRYF0_02320 [Janthinobacterium lividum]
MLRGFTPRYLLLLACLGASPAAWAGDMAWNPFSHMTEAEAGQVLAVLVLLFIALVVGVPLLIGLGTWLVLKRRYPAYAAAPVLPLLFACLGWWGAYGLRGVLPVPPAATLLPPLEAPISVYEKRQALVAAELDSLRKTQLALLSDAEISSYGEAEKAAQRYAAEVAEQRVRTVQGNFSLGVLLGAMGLVSAGAATAGYYTDRKLKT